MFDKCIMSATHSVCVGCCVILSWSFRILPCRVLVQPNQQRHGGGHWVRNTAGSVMSQRSQSGSLPRTTLGCADHGTGHEGWHGRTELVIYGEEEEKGCEGAMKWKWERTLNRAWFVWVGSSEPLVFVLLQMTKIIDKTIMAHKKTRLVTRLALILGGNNEALPWF